MVVTTFEKLAGLDKYVKAKHTDQRNLVLFCYSRTKKGDKEFEWHHTSQVPPEKKTHQVPAM